MVDRQAGIELSVVVPVGVRSADAVQIHAAYKAGLDALGRTYELIFVLDGPREQFAAGLRSLLEAGHRFTVVSLSRQFGEATALMAGFETAVGSVIVTLPAYHQIDSADVSRLLAALESSDLAIGRRWPRAGGLLERFRREVFHVLLAWVTRLRFHDLGCGARAFDRRVLEGIQLYGDQHRFFAVLAERQGFRVQEVDVRQSAKDRFDGAYRLHDYIRGLLDIFTVFFLVRFTKQPLRFFGTVGVMTFAIGALLVTWLVVERLFLGQALAGRPALLLSSLLVVLGLQLFALGVLGELMIFTHARTLKDYQIESVIQFHGATPPGAPGNRST